MTIFDLPEIDEPTIRQASIEARRLRGAAVADAFGAVIRWIGSTSERLPTPVTR
jgi:hypothetical protein